MNNIEEYLINPCGTLSLPYWKSLQIDIPDNIVIIHYKDFNGQYKQYQRFFRLKHDLKQIHKPTHNTFIIEIEKDKNELIEMINLCYSNEGIKIKENDLKNWQQHPTYNDRLWIKIMDGSKIIASGIAEYDSLIKEGILEWIQVLPEYQKKGLGRSLIYALLSELKQLGADFVTVSGNLDNKTNPEILYRKCGFYGNDVWYICQK